jgi:hypothetical protein
MQKGHQLLLNFSFMFSTFAKLSLQKSTMKSYKQSNQIPKPKKKLNLFRVSIKWRFSASIKSVRIIFFSKIIKSMHNKFVKKKINVKTKTTIHFSQNHHLEVSLLVKFFFPKWFLIIFNLNQFDFFHIMPHLCAHRFVIVGLILLLCTISAKGIYMQN